MINKSAAELFRVQYENMARQFGENAKEVTLPKLSMAISSLTRSFTIKDWRSVRSGMFYEIKDSLPSLNQKKFFELQMIRKHLGLNNRSQEFFDNHINSEDREAKFDLDALVVWFSDEELDGLEKTPENILGFKQSFYTLRNKQNEMINKQLIDKQ